MRLIQKDNQTVAQIYPHQGSGVLSSASWADGLVGVLTDKEIEKGDAIDYLLFEGLF